MMQRLQERVSMTIRLMDLREPADPNSSVEDLPIMILKSIDLTRLPSRKKMERGLVRILTDRAKVWTYESEWSSEFRSGAPKSSLMVRSAEKVGYFQVSERREGEEARYWSTLPAVFSRDLGAGCRRLSKVFSKKAKHL